MRVLSPDRHASARATALSLAVIWLEVVDFWLNVVELPFFFLLRTLLKVSMGLGISPAGLSGSGTRDADCVGLLLRRDR